MNNISISESQTVKSVIPIPAVLHIQLFLFQYASSLPSLKKPIIFTSSTENLQNLSGNLSLTENLQLSATSSAYVINSSRKGSLVSILQDEGLVTQNGKVIEHDSTRQIFSNNFLVDVMKNFQKYALQADKTYEHF